MGSHSDGVKTFVVGETRIGEVTIDLFKLTTARPTIFSELNF